MDYPFMIDDYNFVRDRDTCHIILFFFGLKEKIWSRHYRLMNEDWIILFLIAWEEQKPHFLWI